LEPLLRVRGLRHTYALDSGVQIDALDGIDLDIAAGEFVALVGPNGSGKSTLAHHLNGLLLPSAGEVRVAGMLTSADQHKWRIRQRVGIVFQNPDYQLVASTVEEDVAFALENQGVPPDEMRQRVDAALRAVGLLDRANRPPHMLSGGQRQLVAIAGVLAVQPACIVLDEPTSMLDPAGRQCVLDTIRRINDEQGTTVVLITQSMDEAATADRVVVMHEGRIVAQGPPAVTMTQAVRLRSLGLEPPPAANIARQLAELGVPLPSDVLTVSDLVRALCTSRC
jgi:energy-coupling factor transport system ATP-binding protein